MDLAQCLVKEKRTAWVPFKNGFEVQIEFVSKRDLQRITDSCRERRWVNHQPVEELSEAKLAVRLSALIHDWRGLHPEIAATIVPVDVQALGKDDIPCTETNKLTLLKDGYDFDRFVMDAIIDFNNFRDQQQAVELENLEPAPGGNASTPGGK